MGTLGHITTIFWNKALRMSYFWILSPPSLRQRFSCPQHLQIRSGTTVKWRLLHWVEIARLYERVMILQATILIDQKISKIVLVQKNMLKTILISSWYKPTQHKMKFFNLMYSRKRVAKPLLPIFFLWENTWIEYTPGNWLNVQMLAQTI